MSGLLKKAKRKGAFQAAPGSQGLTGIPAGMQDPARRAGPDTGADTGGPRRRPPMDRRRRQGNRRLGTEVRTPLAP